MKYILTVLLLCFCLSRLAAQEKHFIFIQSDNNLPFYVSVNGKLHSSSASGYVIIPKLADDNYKISVGFAQNAFPEQGFEIVVANKDLGFNLKNFSEKGWGLFNLQSLAVTMAGSSTPDDVAKALNEKTAAKDDYEPLISFNRKKKAAPVNTKNVAGTPAAEQAATTEKPTSEDKAGSIAATDLQKLSETQDKAGNIAATDVQKLSETRDEDGLHLSYTEDGGKKSDTIHISISADKALSNTENTASPADTANAENSAAIPSKPAESANGATAKDDVKFLDINTDKSEKDAAEATTTNNNTAVITNSKCKNIATEEDYARLRKKMAMETTDEKMINVAKKIYRNKCFTTDQIKKLSTLFLSDEARYNFFNASYNSVSDTAGYSTLQSEFIDPAFVNRFKAMLQ